MKNKKLKIIFLQKKVEGLVAKANFSLREDVSKLIKGAYSKEGNKKAKKALGWILDNAHIAKNERLAICQDTGLPVVFIEAGSDVRLSYSMVKVIEDAVVSGYVKNYLRPSIVAPLKRGKSSYKGVITHLDFSSKTRGLKITIFPKGFGSENKSQVKMFNPTVEWEEIENFIVESVRSAGPASCPPFFVGVGIGGTSDKALLLAKKALLTRLDKPNSDKSLNRLEKGLLKKINSLGVGPMGFGGNNTALAVRIKTASTHIAGLPVGVNISCHALRSATIQI
jgi:fumarate hydratase subunit alpha